jgi:regulatory factor X, other
LQSFDQHDPTHDLASQYQQANNQPQNVYIHQQIQSTYPPLEPALLQAAHHLSQRDSMPLDPSLNLSALSATDSMTSQGMQNGPDLSAHSFDHVQSTQPMYQILKAALSQSQPPVPTGTEVEEKKKKGSASSATNDKELREMLVRNEGRALKEVAAEVIATERTSKAEKSKQLFAMLW